MAGKTGDTLGVDLARVRYAGSHDLPAVSDDYLTAYGKVPVSVAWRCARTGLGQDPSAALDGVIDRVNKFLLDTRTALDDTGEALVWIADEYATTDSTCQAAFNAERQDLEN